MPYLNTSAPKSSVATLTCARDLSQLATARLKSAMTNNYAHVAKFTSRITVAQGFGSVLTLAAENETR